MRESARLTIAAPGEGSGIPCGAPGPLPPSYIPCAIDCVGGNFVPINISVRVSKEGTLFRI